jgi:hypothetical protein
MKSASIFFVLLLVGYFAFAAGNIDVEKAHRVIPTNLPEIIALDGINYRVINFDPNHFVFDLSKDIIKRDDYLFLDGLVYQVYNGSWIGIGLPDTNWYGIWWDLNEYISLTENDHVRVYGRVKEINNGISLTGHINIIKIEKLE